VNQHVFVPKQDDKGNGYSALHSGLAGGFSLSVWFSFRGGQDSAVIEYGEGDFDGYALRLCTAEGVTFLRHDSVVAEMSKDGLRPSLGWNHVVVSWDFDSGTLELWANGDLFDVTEQHAFVAHKLAAFRIGGRSSNAFKGDIDEVRVYDRALNAAEIEALYTEG
jgi:hypothetical protein